MSTRFVDESLGFAMGWNYWYLVRCVAATLTLAISDRRNSGSPILPRSTTVSPSSWVSGQTGCLRTAGFSSHLPSSRRLHCSVLSCTEKWVSCTFPSNFLCNADSRQSSGSLRGNSYVSLEASSWPFSLTPGPSVVSTSDSSTGKILDRSQMASMVSGRRSFSLRSTTAVPRCWR